MNLTRKSFTLIFKIFFLGLLLSAFFSCGDQGIPINDLRGQIEGGAKRSVELVFDAKSPVVALIDNKRGVLYAATSAGDIYKISGVNKAELIYRGLATCNTSWTAFAVTNEGILIANMCRDKKDVILTIRDTGAVKDLVMLDDRVLALASDSTGKLYIAVWMSEGNVSISPNPRSLAGAEYLKGKILSLEPNGALKQLYEGGIPVWISVNSKDTLFAAVWGKKGYFAPEKKTYSYLDPYRAYWLSLSDKVQFINVAEGKKLFDNMMVNSLSLFVMPQEDYLLGYGIAKDGTSGLLLIEEKRYPTKLLLQEEKYDKNITSLALFNSVVYFGNSEGRIYRIK
jgi:hypothetical protein